MSSRPKLKDVKRTRLVPPPDSFEAVHPDSWREVEVDEISQVIEAVKSQADEISTSQLAFLQRVYAEAQQAQENLQKAIAEQQACSGARQAFMVFLFGEYNLDKQDEIDLQTGKITRK